MIWWCEWRRCPRGKIRIRWCENQAGKEFEERVASARDFFDYWIERKSGHDRSEFTRRKNAGGA